jgi:hypothetical protein
MQREPFAQSGLSVKIALLSRHHDRNNCSARFKASNRFERWRRLCCRIVMSKLAVRQTMTMVQLEHVNKRRLTFATSQAVRLGN